MNRAVMLGMIAITGCADLEPDQLPEASVEQGITQGNSPADQVTREISTRAGVIRAVQGFAAAAPSGCDRGAFCAYTGYGGTGVLVLERQGNWSGSVGGVAHVFNNGRPFPGADHVQFDWLWPDGTPDTLCIHYSPGPGTFAWDFDPAGIRATRVRWRGECGPGEDV